MNWNDIKKGIGDIADKATRKTEEIADLAAIKLKIAKLSSDKENEFLKLGKITYKKLSGKFPSHENELTQRLSESVARITAIGTDIESLKLEYDLKKQEAEARKKAKKSDGEDFSEDELNTSVLDSFDVEE